MLGAQFSNVSAASRYSNNFIMNIWTCLAEKIGMFDLKTFALAINQISEEKGIQQEKVIETIEQAIAAAYKKEYRSKSEVVRAKLDPESGQLQFWQVKLVVDESMLRKEGEEIEESQSDEEPRKVKFNEDRHIMVDEAKKVNPDIKPGEDMLFPLENYDEFGRIAAQTAKQVILQRLREAERDAVFQEFKHKEGEIISGQIQSMEGRNIFVDIGKTVGVMFFDETIPNEHYRIGDRMRFYIYAVEQNVKGSSVFLSRSHPFFIDKLFELEVPEISEKTVEIKAIAREAGSRSKIAVASHKEGVDPIGSCVGQKGTRVNAVINEINGEKIDIIEWSEEVEVFIAHALSPAKVVAVEVGERRTARVFVADDQLSLAIGKRGQNVRLAAKLTGWKLDVRSAGKPEEAVEGGVAEGAEEPGVVEEKVETAAAEEFSEAKE